MLTENDKAVLHFSGGKDSLACLYLCRPWWDRITVLWVNAGNPYPETVEQMAQIKALVPHFAEVRGDQPAWIAAMGLPVDVVPIMHGTMGRLAGSTEPLRLQSTFDCCAHNLWLPMREAMRQMGATVAIRGQKQCDEFKGQLRDGDVFEGITYRHPLDAWSDADVMAYLHAQGVELPPQYARGVNTSFDCMDCTGYASHNAVRWAQMAETHPDLWASFGGKLAAVRAALDCAVRPYMEQSWQ